jgi:hypothetical protein
VCQIDTQQANLLSILNRVLSDQEWATPQKRRLNESEPLVPLEKKVFLRLKPQDSRGDETALRRLLKQNREIGLEISELEQISWTAV